MRFRIERDALAEAVAWVARALPARPVVPILSGLLLDAAGGTLALSCFDYDVSARAEVGAEVAEPGTALVPGRLLAEISRSLSGPLAEFTDDQDSVLLTCGSAEFTLVKLAVEEYPSLPELPPSAGTIEGAHLAAAVSQVAPSASRDDNLPMLTGVFAEIEGGTITLAATDRYRLAVRGLPWAPGQDDLRTSALIPAKALAEAARTMTSGGGRVSIALPGAATNGANGTPPGQDARAADGMIGFEGGGRRLTARLLGGDFIKYSSRFPAEFGSSADMDPGPLIEAVRRVSLVAERGSPVRLVFDDDEVVIEAGSQGQARAIERVPATFTGDERVIAFNPNYLLDGLNAAATPWASSPAKPSSAESGESAKAKADTRPAGPGRIRLEFTSSAKPAVISWVPGADDPPDDDEENDKSKAGFRYLVVPLRMPGSA
ncbi:MAG TPA: DNA polymerase III subunit beta [Streptosporangiaceae bacterium]|jgi:DNA polymerase-3 subunit beta|nr:DNA polymerase III subunit beta [Streptosporangiaceae bacterium]